MKELSNAEYQVRRICRANPQACGRVQAIVSNARAALEEIRPSVRKYERQQIVDERALSDAQQNWIKAVHA